MPFVLRGEGDDGASRDLTLRVSLSREPLFVSSLVARVPLLELREVIAT